MSVVRQKRKDKEALQNYRAKLEMIRTGAAMSLSETDDEKQAVIEATRKCPVECAKVFFPHYCTSETAPFLREFAISVMRDTLMKGFLEAGRGHAKSVWSTIIIPFWLWHRGEPMYQVVIGSSYDKAKQLLSDIQAEFEANPRIAHYCGEQKRLGSWEDGFFITTGGYIGQALGTGQSVRGLRVKNLRPTYINPDDIETKPINKNPKRQDEIVKWIERDLIPCMDGAVRRFIYTCNKYAKRMIQTILQERHPKWYVKHVKAYDPVTYKTIAWPQKYPDGYFKRLEEEIGVLACKAEYNQEPQVEGKIFKPEQIQWAKLPRIDHFQLIVGHWDVAYAGTPTSDYNAVRLWGLYKGRFYLIDCYVKQSKMKGAIAWMCATQKDIQERTSTDIYIQWQYESQFWNDEVERTIQETAKEHGMEYELNLIKVDRPKSNKYDRILSMQVYYQNGRIYFNEDLKSHNDTEEGNAQLLGIEPNYSSHDDAPDADEAALKRLSQEITTGNQPPPSYGDTYENKSF